MASKDINAAKNKINKDNGKNGVQWVLGLVRGGHKVAGGRGQPVIYLTQDAVITGYNVLIGNHRAYDDLSAPSKTTTNQRLVTAFATPKAAGLWVAKVVGEQEVTTYAQGPKQTHPGIGLLNDVQNEAVLVKQNLAELVQGRKALTLQNLKAVSPPKVMLNRAVIQMLRKQTNPLMQAIYVSKLAQEVAIARVIDKSKLGLQLLEIGRQVPSIFANPAAQKGLREDLRRLRQSIRALRESPKDNTAFVGRTVAMLLGATNAQEARSAAIRPSANTPPLVQNGAGDH